MKYRSFVRGEAGSLATQLRIVYQSISQLKPNPENPRRHSKKQIRQIADSIEAFGFNVPILIDREGKVIAGHGRLAACHELGWSEVPTLCLDHLSPAQARAFMIADNRLTEISTWDDRLLAEQLKDLSLSGLDFDLEMIGFEVAEIDLRIASLEDLRRSRMTRRISVRGPRRSAAQQDRRHVAPGPPSAVVWQCAGRRGFRGADGEERAAAVFTDPPYNVPIDGHASGLGAIHHRPFPMATGEMGPAEFTAFLTRACRNLAAFSREASLHYICMDWRHLDEMLAAGREAYGELKNLCVWVKDNGGMGSLYRSQHELILLFKHGRAPHRNNVQLGRFGRNRSNVWHYPGVNSFARNGAEGNLLALHPTVKPVAMVADAILNSTARGDIVLDAFLGSGTTLIAAERTGRRCCGLELDPAYVDTIIRRWQALTGGTAHHAASGRSFDDLAREAEAADAA